MDFYEVVRKRRSIRSFSEKIPPLELIEKIIDTARLAPTWANVQGVEYIIVSESDKVYQIWQAINQGDKFRSAQIFIVGIISELGSGKNPESGLRYFLVDFGICFDHLILAATAEGLATCWIGKFNEKKIKEILDIPNEFRIIGITPLGYAKKEYEPRARKPLEEILHYEKFLGKK